MLSKKRQTQYCNSAWHRLEKQFHIFCDSGDLEALHKLRLEIKKIDSFVFLISNCDPGRKLSAHLKPVKKMFKHAGLIRSANLNLKLAEKHNIHNTEYIEAQHRTIAFETEEFISRRNTYSSKFRKSLQKITGKLTDINDKHISHVYLQEYKRTKRYILQDNYGEKLHNNRKKIKFLIYTYEHLNKSIRKRLEPDMPFLDTLQNTIGIWHDYDSSIELLKGNSPVDVQAIRLLEEQMQHVLITIHSIAREMELNDLG